MFFYDYQDAQYPSTVRDPVSDLLESRFFNLEKVTSMGAELETVWAVTDAFVMRLNYSYLDTEIKDARCFVDDADTGISAARCRRMRGRARTPTLGAADRPVARRRRTAERAEPQGRVQRELHVLHGGSAT